MNLHVLISRRVPLGSGSSRLSPVDFFWSLHSKSWYMVTNLPFGIIDLYLSSNGEGFSFLNELWISIIGFHITRLFNSLAAILQLYCAVVLSLDPSILDLEGRLQMLLR